LSSSVVTVVIERHQRRAPQSWSRHPPAPFQLHLSLGTATRPCILQAILLSGFPSWIVEHASITSAQISSPSSASPARSRGGIVLGSEEGHESTSDDHHRRAAAPRERRLIRRRPRQRDLPPRRRPPRACRRLRISGSHER